MTTLKKFIKNFDINKPDWSDLPKGFPNCDLDGFTGSEVAKWNSIKTMWELSRSKKPKSRSRAWKDPKGYQYLGVWQNAALLRTLIRKFTRTLPLNPTLNNPYSKPLEYRLKAQMDDAARSVKRNIEEGYARPTTSEYLQFLGYSQGSLKEAKGDVERMHQDGFLESIKGSGLKDLGIDLKEWNSWAKNPANSSKILFFPLKDNNKGNYRTLKEIKGKDITYEVFIELINKTDYLLRRLVKSLEKKLDDERRGYRVEQSRIKSKLKKK